MDSYPLEYFVLRKPQSVDLPNYEIKSETVNIGLSFKDVNYNYILRREIA